MTIAYPGNLQGRHIRETGAHGALLVTAEGTQITRIDRLEVDVLRWHLLEIDASQADDLPDALRLVGQALDQLLRQEPAHMVLAVRVRFAGASGAHAALLRSDQQLRHEVIAQAVALNPERLWIEKVNTDTQPLQLAQAPASGAAANAFAELQDLARTAPQDESFAQALQASWQAVLEKLPHEVLAQAPELAALRQQPEEALAAQLQDALTLLGARTGAAADADR